MNHCKSNAAHERGKRFVYYFKTNTETKEFPLLLRRGRGRCAGATFGIEGELAFKEVILGLVEGTHESAHVRVVLVAVCRHAFIWDLLKAGILEKPETPW